MAQSGLRFIHKDGRIIPIRAAQSAGTVARKAVAIGKAASAIGATASAAKATRDRSKNKFTAQPMNLTNKKWDAAGIGLSVASGAVAAATFGLGAKGFIAGQLASHGIDALSIAANVKGVAGKGHTKERVIQGARNEARNQILGYGVYGAGIVAVKTNREAAVKYGSKGLAYGKKVLDLARKALRVIR